ncbi:MAG: hypothetical protein ACRD68_04935 [Pyrinomonadaceae bacterium]
MGDWIGLGIIVLVLAGGLAGLARLGTPREPLTPDEFERRVREGPGSMSAGVAGAMYALQKLMNPKAAEAVEVQKYLRAGYYDDVEASGEGDEPGAAAGDPDKSETEGEDA